MPERPTFFIKRKLQIIEQQAQKKWGLQLYQTSREIGELSQGMMDRHQYLRGQVKWVFQQPLT